MFMVHMSIQQRWGSVVYTANIQTHYSSQTTRKKATQSTYGRKKLKLKSLSTQGTQPAIKVVT